MSDTRIKITARGIYGADGKEIPVGTELTVKAEPTAWAGRYETISGGDAKGKKTVTNPAGGDAKGDLKHFEFAVFKWDKDGNFDLVKR